MKVCMFPGQGSQKIGMGKMLFNKYPEHVRKANEILGYSIEELCNDNEKANLLNKTEFTQPALYVVNALSYIEFLEHNDPPEYLIGHSLGEYNALQAAGVINYETGIQLVQKRGALMGKIKGGGMAAVLDISMSTIREVLKENNFTRIDVANMNSYKETIISAPEEEIAGATEALKKVGAYVIRLNVSGPFHSRYMGEILAEYEEILAKIHFLDPQIPVLSNCTAREYTKEKVMKNLLLQLTNSVRWTEMIEYLNKKGCYDYIQVGPGRVLTKLCNNILNKI